MTNRNIINKDINRLAFLMSILRWIKNLPNNIFEILISNIFEYYNRMGMLTLRENFLKPWRTSRKDGLMCLKSNMRQIIFFYSFNFQLFKHNFKNENGNKNCWISYLDRIRSCWTTTNSIIRGGRSIMYPKGYITQNLTC